MTILCHSKKLCGVRREETFFELIVIWTVWDIVELMILISSESNRNMMKRRWNGHREKGKQCQRKPYVFYLWPVLLWCCRSLEITRWCRPSPQGSISLIRTHHENRKHFPGHTRSRTWFATYVRRRGSAGQAESFFQKCAESRLLRVLYWQSRTGRTFKTTRRQLLCFLISCRWDRIRLIESPLLMEGFPGDAI